MFKQILLLAYSALLSISIFAADLNPIMHQLGDKLLQVLPGLYDGEVDSDTLRKDIDEMRVLFRQAESHLSADPGSRANYDLLMEQLGRSSQYVSDSSTPMMRQELKEAFAVCVSCISRTRVLYATTASANLAIWMSSSPQNTDISPGTMNRQ